MVFLSFIPSSRTHDNWIQKGEIRRNKHATHTSKVKQSADPWKSSIEVEPALHKRRCHRPRMTAGSRHNSSSRGESSTESSHTRTVNRHWSPGELASCRSGSIFSRLLLPAGSLLASTAAVEKARMRERWREIVIDFPKTLTWTQACFLQKKANVSCQRSKKITFQNRNISKVKLLEDKEEVGLTWLRSGVQKYRSIWYRECWSQRFSNKDLPTQTY